MPEPISMKLEVVFIAVSDVDRAKAFYEKLGWRVDIDITVGEFRGVQVTPHNSEAAVIFGSGMSSVKAGSAQGPILAVSDLVAARNSLVERGIDVSEIFHYAAGPFNETVKNARVSGPDPEGRSYFSFAEFKDPDGNGWTLQEITMRLPGREWKRDTDVSSLAQLLHETGERHDHFEKSHVAHNWWDWYAPYLSARQNGSSPEDASAAADRYMEETLHVLPR